MDQLDRVERKVDQLLFCVGLIIRLERHIMSTLADVQTAVTAEDTVIDGAITLLQGLAAAVAALPPNQAAIDSLAADITSKTATLAAAVAAITPPAKAAVAATP